jgi:hypothetical protein
MERAHFIKCDGENCVCQCWIDGVDHGCGCDMSTGYWTLYDGDCTMCKACIDRIIASDEEIEV